MIIPVGETDISIDVQIVDDLGIPVDGLIAATWPATYFSKGTGADVTITPSDLSALTDAHTDGGVYGRGGGMYRLDLPDSVSSTAANRVIVRAEVTGKRMIVSPIQVGGDVLSVTLAPVVGTVTERIDDNSNIKTYVGEDYVATVYPLDADDVAVNPSTWSTIEVIIEDHRGTELLTIAHGSISQTSTSITFTVPAATINIEPAVHKWACRSVSGKVVRMAGLINVKYAAGGA